jgi:P27 family predicted phage terminase small subunit
MPGPTPKPTRLRELEGVPGHHRPLNKGEPQPIGPLVKPRTLTGDAAVEWDRVVASMPPGLYTSADAPVLAAYCEAWVLLQAALAILKVEGIVITGARGGPVLHPAMNAQSKQTEIILKAADRLGLTPGARSRLTVGDPPDDGRFGGLYGGAQLRVATSNGPSGSARSSRT